MPDRGLASSGAQHESVVFDPQVTVLACQEPFDLGQRALQLGFALVEALQPLAGRPGLAHDLWPPVRPLTGGNEIGVRIGIAAAMLTQILPARRALRRCQSVHSS